MSSKSVPEECQVRSAKQEVSSKKRPRRGVLSKSVLQEWHVRVSSKKRLTRVSSNSVLEECQARVSHKSVKSECQARVSYPSVAQ